VAVALLAVRSSGLTVSLFERTLEKSSQLAVRWIVVLVFALGLLASDLGLDLLLGGFAAGLITRQVLKEREVPGFDSKLTGVAFGVFVPFFFIVSGMSFDLDALTKNPVTLLRVPLFLGLFLLVRGAPILLLYRRDLSRVQVLPMVLLSATALPLVVAITEIGLETGRMKPENAAALVGAAVLSVLIFPFLAFLWQRHHPDTPEDTTVAPPDEPTEIYEDEADI
jgi:Kef-type K+ transport system membrane component KefB